MIACPHCDAELDLDGFDIGDRVECSDCEQVSELASKTRLVGVMAEDEEPEGSNPYTPPKGRTAQRSVHRQERMSTPGAVWFIAVMDFLSAAVIVLAAFGLLAIADDGGVSAPGIMVLFGLMAVIPLGLGVGMIRGMKPAWYIHIVLVVLGVLGNLASQPMNVFGLGVNALWLLLLFWPSTRAFFGSGGPPARRPRSRRREPREHRPRRGTR